MAQAESPPLPQRSTFLKLGLLGSLYFSQGLPFGFFVQALPVLLRKKGFSLSEIGLSSLLALPWALKFIWAPAVDRYSFSRLGRRKSWILPLQIATVIVLGILAASTFQGSMNVLMAAVLVLNFLAATQDIATDGLAVDLLLPHERGFANGLQVAGYRVGMIVGGGVLLIVEDRIGTAGIFACMAGLTALATLPILASREPPPPIAHSTQQAPRPEHFLFRRHVPKVLALIVTYKAGDAFATGMLRPYLSDAGLSLSDVGWLLGTVGFISGLLGAVAGGLLVARIGRKRALLLFGLLQALTVAGYAYLATHQPSRVELYTLCGAEYFAGGMATAALFTTMMDWCSKENSATDYTVQASAVVIATGGAGALAGVSAQRLGYLTHFWLSAALALGALAVVYALFPTQAEAANIRGERQPPL
ncbi:MAG: MFS transporter [Polyangiaceae bacterium]|nr:MFS transporter [Polyangiaceae bacterium]